MTMLTESQKNYLSKRTRLTKSWTWVGSLLLAGIVSFYAYFFVKHPLLANPYDVIDQIASNSLSDSTLSLLAVFCPIAFIICGFLLLALILFVFAAMSNERKLLKIIEAIQESSRSEEFKD
ncbi:MAG: hypothetical protein ACMUIA_08965 [bacterium]